MNPDLFFTTMIIISVVIMFLSFYFMYRDVRNERILTSDEIEVFLVKQPDARESISIRLSAKCPIRVGDLDEIRSFVNSQKYLRGLVAERNKVLNEQIKGLK